MGASNNHLNSESYDEGQLIRIIDSAYGLSVIAAMPETYSIGAGSEITSPFSSFAADGTASAVVA